MNNKGISCFELILILVVLIVLVLIFKKQLTMMLLNIRDTCFFQLFHQTEEWI